MKTIDLHQDLMTHIRFRDVVGQSEQTSFSLLESSEIELVVATAFPMPPDDNQFHTSVPALITEELQMYEEFVGHSDIWSIIKNVDDLDADGKKLLLHIEGLNVFDGSLDSWAQLEEWHSGGVRSIGTHWNVENALGGGTLQPEIGLTSLGTEVLRYIEDKKILLDMAHMSRQTFWDAVPLLTRPIYISHGNTDALCSNVRNYTDEQLQEVAKSGGVIGVFFPNTFVSGKGQKGSIDDVVAHIQYIHKLIGIEHIAIGSDFGGIVTGTVDGLASVTDIPCLWSALKVAGFSESTIEAIAYGNAHRVINDHL